ncbi:MAG TPA: M23 family metallopeptidase, partial [Bacteroidota bacterium]|nr:M23 family metallopeptidase [Bacteroidota bacterium]
MPNPIRIALIITGAILGALFFITYPADPLSAAGSSGGDRIRIPDPDSVRMNFRGYVWPTDASRKITSSFAEFRTLHFHGGIDISTNGTVGHRVFAVQDGYLLRVRITPSGYGKMLYLRHPDGYVSTYAHLKSFNPEIERLASAEQYRTGRYEIDLLYSGPVHRVGKGDVIAYTGDTGFGPPHLHFEIRDTNLNPVNPLLGESFRQEDRIPPNIYRLLVRPLSAGSRVNDRDNPRIYSRFPRRDGGYRLAEKIRIRGEVGFAVETVDRSNGVAGRKGVHMTDLTLDGQNIFHSELNAIPILKTAQIYLHYDFPMILAGKGRFQKLYVERGNELPFYMKTGRGRGIVRAGELAEGEHAFSIICTDIYGNRSELSGTLVVEHPPAIALAGVDDSSLRLVDLSRSPIDLIRVMGRKQYAPTWEEHTVHGSVFTAAGDSIDVPVNTARYDIVSVLARTPLGSWSDPVIDNLRKVPGPAHTISIDHEVIGDDLKISVSTAGVFTAPPSVVVSEGLRAVPVPMTPADVSLSVGYYHLPDYNSEAGTIQARAGVNGHEVSSESRLELFSIPPD